MSAFFAILLVTMLDPFRAVPAAVMGWKVEKPFQILLGATVISVLTELLLSFMRITYQFDVLRFVLSVVACAAWAFGFNWLRRRREKVKA